MFESLCKGRHNVIVILHVLQVCSLNMMFFEISGIHKAVTGEFGVHHNIHVPVCFAFQTAAG